MAEIKDKAHIPLTKEEANLLVELLQQNEDTQIYLKAMAGEKNVQLIEGIRQEFEVKEGKK